MKKLYSLFLMALTAIAVNAQSVTLSADVAVEDDNGTALADGTTTFNAEIDGNTIKISDFPGISDLELYVLSDGEVGCNALGTWYSGTFNFAGLEYTKYYLYNNADYPAFEWSTYEGKQYITTQLITYNYDYVNIDIEVPEGFVPREIGDVLNASAVDTSYKYHDADMCGVWYDDHLEVSKIFGTATNINIYWDNQTGKVTTTIPQAWRSGYYEFNNEGYYYLRDFYQGTYHECNSDVYGKYLKLYIELATSTSTQLWVYIYFPDTENDDKETVESTIDMKTWTAYNSKYTDYNVPVTAQGTKYTIENFLDSDFTLEVKGDVESKGTITSNLPVDRLKKTFYIDDVKFTYMAEHSEADNEWVGDAMAVYFQLYSSSIGDWTWVTTYIYPNTLKDGVENITVDDSNAPIEVFNLNGVRMNSENLPAGLYIRRQGRNVSKVVIR